MCVEEEGFWGGASSIILQLMDHTAPLIYLPLQGVERDRLLSGSASVLILAFLFRGWMDASVQPGTRCIDHGARREARLLRASVSDAARRLHPGFIQGGLSWELDEGLRKLLQ